MQGSCFYLYQFALSEPPKNGKSRVKTQCGYSDYGYRIDCYYSFEVSKIRYFGNIVSPFVQEVVSDEEAIEQRVSLIESNGAARYLEFAPQICLLEPPPFEMLRFEMLRLIFVFLTFSICVFFVERFALGN